MEYITASGLGLVALMSLIQISPMKLNPWDRVLGWLGKKLNGAQLAALQKQIRALLDNHPEVLQMHGFYLEEEPPTLRFDIILDFDAQDRHGAYEQICREVQALVPDYAVAITLDYDITD